MENLTNARANSISKPGLHGDGQTLYLRVAKSGRKSWIQRVTIEGCRHDIGLGPYPQPADPGSLARWSKSRTRVLS